MEKIERMTDQPTYERVLSGSKKVKETVYIASDGKEFVGGYTAEQDCRQHERKLRSDELLKDVLQKHCKYEEFYDWYLFNDQHSLLEYMKFLSSVSPWWYDWSAKINYPQWVGIKLCYGGDDRADYYEFVCLDDIRNNVKILTKTLLGD
jgi:hypothetical protein